jgi:hypothetical protein
MARLNTNNLQVAALHKPELQKPLCPISVPAHGETAAASAPSTTHRHRSNSMTPKPGIRLAEQISQTNQIPGNYHENQ